MFEPLVYLLLVLAENFLFYSHVTVDLCLAAKERIWLGRCPSFVVSGSIETPDPSWLECAGA